MEEVAKIVCDVNPIAICRPQNKSGVTGRADRRHFDGDPPRASLLCHKAKVSLDGKNYAPTWGLHNGAMGSVDENVFTEGTNPNHGDLPAYTVVNLPLYKGPVWDPFLL